MTQQAARTLSLDRVVYHDGLSFGVVRHKRQLQPDFIQNVDAFVVQVDSSAEALDILREVRQMTADAAFLKPVFVHPNLAKIKAVVAEFDGISTADDLTEAVERSNEINKRIDKLPTQNASHKHPDGELLVRVSQYIYTRQSSMQPLPDRNSKLHYRFPFLTGFYAEHEEHKALSVLKLGEKQGWFNTKKLDVVHLCPSCDSAHHNLRATCPKCHSVDIKEEDLVHHFPCAHIAPISDFQKHGQDGLVCPKCDKSLRHIGNDYDKPSAIYNCHDCHHTFQEAAYRALCIECEEDVAIEKLVEANICQYELTSKGHSAIQHGTQVGTASISKRMGASEPGVFEFDVFQILVRQEMVRQKAQEKPTAMVGQVKIDGLPMDKFSEDMKERLSSEVCSIIKSYLKPSDVVSSKEARMYYFMLPEAEQKTANNIKDVLTFNLNKLISSNLHDKNANVQVELEPLVR